MDRYDADNHRIENSSVKEYHLYSSEALEGCLPHKRVETNRRVAEHNSYQWEPIVYWNTRSPNRTNMLSIKQNLVLVIFIIRYWMAFDEVRPIARYWYPCSPFFFEKQRWIHSLNLDFSIVYGMMVYKVEKSNVLMLLHTYWDLEIEVSSKSFELFNIHIWLTPLLERKVSLYLWRLVLIAVKIEIKV